MKKLVCLLLVVISSLSITTSCNIDASDPDPILVARHEITANYSSFTVVPNEKYEFISETVLNATFWKYDLRFYKNDLEITSIDVTSNVTMFNYDGVSSFSYNGISISNDADVSGLNLFFENVDADRVDIRIRSGDTTPLVSTVNNKLLCLSGNETPCDPPAGVGSSEPNIVIEDCVDAETAFGLVPDLGTDQTAAFTSLLNSNETHIYIKDGEYFINGHIVMDADKDKAILGGRNTVIKHTINTNNTLGIKCYSALHLEHIIFDYDNGPCFRGLYFEEGCGTIILQHVTFRNIYDLELTPLGTVVFNIQAYGNIAHLDGISLQNIIERGDDVVGTAPGNLTCIYLWENLTQAPLDGYIRNVTIENVHNVDESGDIIMDDVSCIYLISGTVTTTSMIEVSKVRASDYGKRAIKVFCNGFKIDDVVAHADTYDCLSVLGVNGSSSGFCGRGTINNVTVTGYANAGISVDGKHITCTNLTSHVMLSPLYEDAFPFFIGFYGEDITIDGFDFSGERVLFHNPNSVTDVNEMTDITFRNGSMKSNKLAGFQFNGKSKGFNNLKFENVRVEQSAASTSKIGFLDCTNLSWSPFSKGLTMTACSMKSSGPVSNGVLLKYIDGITIDDMTIESGGSYENVISLESCSNGTISALTNNATAENLVKQSRCKNIDISDL